MKRLFKGLNYLVPIGLALLGDSAFAQYAPGADFLKFQQDFESGKSVSATELLGAYSGRCIGYWQTASEASNLLHLIYASGAGAFRAASISYFWLSPQLFDAYKADQAFGKITESSVVNPSNGGWDDSEGHHFTYRLSSSGVPIVRIDNLDTWDYPGKPWTFCKLVKKLSY